MTVASGADAVVVTVDGCSCELSRVQAAQLQEAVGDALTERREFFRTAGEHREDGSYVVERRGADSSGNAKVFESFEHLRRLYDRLPDTFDAEDVGRTGITGSRRHMLVRHVAEHPVFDCTIASRNPLTAEKSGDGGTSTGDDTASTVDGEAVTTTDGHPAATEDGDVATTADTDEEDVAPGEDDGRTAGKECDVPAG